MAERAPPGWSLDSKASASDSVDKSIPNPFNSTWRRPAASRSGNSSVFMPMKSNWKHLSKPRPQTRKNPLPIVGGVCAPRQNPSNVSGDEGLRRSWVRTATSLTRKLDAPRSRGPYGKGAGFTERQPEVDQDEFPVCQLPAQQPNVFGWLDKT